MAVGKHASRYKSFESLDEGRKERYRKRSQAEDEEDDKLNVHTNVLNSNSEDYEDEYDEPILDYKKVIISIVVIIVIFALAFGIYKLVSANKEETLPIEDDVAQIEEEKMPSTISGYKVLGQVIIENLSVEQYILDSTEDNALKNGVVKLYGPSLNSYGNFCIAGHNYEGIFKDIEKLNVGDEIVIKDDDEAEYEYKVTSVKNIEPDDLECLMQNEEIVEITLITCSEGSTSRVVVKAEEVSKDNG